MVLSKEGREFSFLAPAGYYIALRVGFAFPIAERNALPDKWVDFYTQAGLVLHDPVVRWAYENAGAIRWSAIDGPDPRGVMASAAQFGLPYGVAIACADPGVQGQRSYGSFARPDREYADDEIAELQRKLLRLHTSMAPPTSLTSAEIEALRMVKAGMLLKEIACILKISEGAVKQRLRSSKDKLDAKTSSHAVSIAASFGLI